MTTKFFWSVIPVVLILIGAGCARGQSGQPVATSPTQSESISGSIKDLLKLGKSIKCDMAKASTDIISGTSYISGNKARSDFEMKSGDGKTTTGHFIMDGGTMYSWTDGNKAQAMKVDVAEIEKLAGNPETKTSVADNYSNSMDYKCISWRADLSKFIPPADIKFQDFSALMNQVQNTLQQTRTNLPANMNTQSFCATCDKLSGDAKTQCKQSLGCK